MFLIHVLQALCPVLTYLIHVETILLNLEFGNQTFYQQINLSIVFPIIFIVLDLSFSFWDWSARNLWPRSSVTTLALLSYHRWLLLGLLLRKLLPHGSHQLSYKLLLLSRLIILDWLPDSHLGLLFFFLLLFFIILFLRLLGVRLPRSCWSGIPFIQETSLRHWLLALIIVIFILFELLS